MTDYIHHTGNVIDRAMGRLPRAWRNISGLDRASPDFLKDKGWLPVVEDKPAFDPETQRLTGPTGVNVGDSVPPGAESVTATWAVALRPVPASVGPLQMRRALRAAGLIDSVQTWVSGQDADTKDAWEYAISIERDGPIVAAGARALSLSSGDLDTLFRSASKF